jgi:hypothetical protein
VIQGTEERERGGGKYLGLADARYGGERGMRGGRTGSGASRGPPTHLSSCPGPTPLGLWPSLAAPLLPSRPLPASGSPHLLTTTQRLRFFLLLVIERTHSTAAASSVHSYGTKFFLSTCLQRAFSSSNKFSVDFLHYGTVFSSFTTVLDVVVSYLAIDALETQMPFYDFHHH